MPVPVRVPAEILFSSLTPEQRATLGLPSKGTVEISPIQEKEWLISLSTGQTDLHSKNPVPSAAPLSPIQQKVLRLLKTHKIPDLIEGRFERLLSGEELDAFNELRSRGKVEVIKTNPKFEKGIYREVREGETPRANLPPSLTRAPIPDKSAEEYSLVQDGFMVLRSDGAAKAASFDLAERIKAGEIKGIKSFDGFYYIIENSLLEKHTPRIISVLREKKMLDIGELSTHSGTPVVLARIALEFAKEEGIVIEKKKNIFAYVG